jgi:hypothetical protein
MSGTYQSFQGNGAFPRLTASDAFGSSAWRTGLTVKRGDRVIFSGTSAWGMLNFDTTTFLKVFSFTTASMNCNMISGDGRQASGGGAVALNEGLAPGLMISDGQKSYFVGNSSTISIENDGNLMMGFNAPLITGMDQYCGSIRINQLRVERCENASGVPVSCI